MRRKESRGGKVMKRIRQCVRRGKGTEGKGMEWEVASVKHKKRGEKVHQTN